MKSLLLFSAAAALALNAALAGPLTSQQLATVKADIAANQDLASAQGSDAVAELYNAEASPPYWVWRTDVSRADIYTSQNDLAVSGAQTGFWSWTTYKGQSVTEQNAWVQMFMGDRADFSKANLRAGVAAIFTGTAAATAQANHCLAIGRRKATRLEKLLATGTGSTASPAVMSFEGSVTGQEIDAAKGSQ